MQYKRQAVQYAFEQQKSKNGQRRYNIQVQIYPTGLVNQQEIPYPWQGKMIEELQLIFIVKDEGMASKLGYTQIPNYTGALITFLQWS